MAWPSLLARTKDWGTETLTDSDLEGQFDLIITYINDMMNSTSGHKHDATTAEGPKILINNLTIASRAQGDVYYDNGTNPTRLGAGTSGHFLQTQGAGANPQWASAITSINYSDLPDGVVVGFSYTQSTANTASGTNSPVMDDTVPTTSEIGVISTLTVEHTPRSATNILVVECYPNCTSGANQNVIMGIHDSSASAIVAASFLDTTDPRVTPLPPLRYTVVAGSTNARTYSMYGGRSGGAAFTINANGTSARMGTASIAYISVTEYKAS